MRKILLILLICIVPISLFIGCKESSELDKISSKAHSYEISAKLDIVSKNIIANQLVSYYNNSDAILETVVFHLYPNAFDENSGLKVVNEKSLEDAYYNGFDSGYIDIKSVKIDNTDCIYAFGGTNKSHMIVSLNDKVYPTERIEIQLEYEVKIPNINHRFGFGENTINLGNFYPVLAVYKNGQFYLDEYSACGDPFFSEIASYKVNFICPNNLILASTGEIIAQNNEGDNTSYVISATSVRDFAMVLSEKWSEKIAVTEDEVTVRYLYYGDQNPDASIKTAVDAVNTFGETIGKYPYKILTVVESSFLHGGMEYPNLVLISDNLQSYSEYQNVIVHEIGHQWFYSVVGNDEVNEAWLDESLTEYITALFYTKNVGYDKTYEEVMGASLRSYMLYEDVYTEIYGSVNTKINRPLSGFKSDGEYVYLVYVKGMLMFDNLSQIYGQEKVIKALKNYYNENKFLNSSESNLLKCFIEVCGPESESVILSWLNGTIQIIES